MSLLFKFTAGELDVVLFLLLLHPGVCLLVAFHDVQGRLDLLGEVLLLVHPRYLRQTANKHHKN